MSLVVEGFRWTWPEKGEHPVGKVKGGRRETFRGRRSFLIYIYICHLLGFCRERMWRVNLAFLSYHSVEIYFQRLQTCVLVCKYFMTTRGKKNWNILHLIFVTTFLTGSRLK